MKQSVWISAGMAVALLAGCSHFQKQEPDEYNVDEIDVISEPAYVYCVSQGHKLERFSEGGKRIPYCIISDDERYTVWEYYENREQNQQ
ncbi:DUF333 domain-containing protein [Vibrio hippocampi]|uniref:DUF333 domain-containing protein n=1 Tax=Vibrio hippocampi TaxID=654686 RepID=A0ABM8ZML0_9VIBR|nr:DUF333 domain-containing protein [Vibrio hippocampi]CAH0529702.1 hypothetical protein VHP8226_03457 [Vibrio hippocampi]